MKNDIEDLKAVTDSTFLQVSELTAKINTLNSMVLGVYKETLPAENYRRVYTMYVNVLEENLNDTMNGIENCLFDDSSLVLRRKFELFSTIQNLKRSADYIHPEGGDNSAQ